MLHCVAGFSQTLHQVPPQDILLFVSWDVCKPWLVDWWTPALVSCWKVNICLQTLSETKRERCQQISSYKVKLCERWWSLKTEFRINYLINFSFSMTNAGKSTLSRHLHQQIPNSCIISQDSYFKANSLNHTTDLTVSLSYWPSVVTVHTFSFRMTLWYRWTAMDLSNMTVRTHLSYV